MEPETPQVGSLLPSGLFLLLRKEPDPPPAVGFLDSQNGGRIARSSPAKGDCCLASEKQAGNAQEAAAGPGGSQLSLEAWPAGPRPYLSQGL